MHIVEVVKPKNDSPQEQLRAFYATFRGLSNGECVEFDLSSLDWACPLLLLPIASYGVLNQCPIDSSSAHKNVKSYLKTIDFPSGVDAIEQLQQAQSGDKNFIPIGHLKRSAGVNRDKLEGIFANLVHRVLGALPGTANAVYYPIAELVTNIFEHSRSDDGFILGQYYPKKDYLDICIVDCGRGIAQSYFEELGERFTDAEAITEAMKGYSTKSKMRGTGLRSSKRIVCEALSGSFALISGGAVLLSLGGQDYLIELPNFGWQGVVISYRIPRPKTDVDIARFLEF